MTTVSRSKGPFALDTNVLIYAHQSQGDDREVRAERIVALAAKTGRCVLALQTIGEFFHAATRKKLLSTTRAHQLALDYLALFATVRADQTDVARALDAATTGSHSYWDALLLATLSREGCTMLLSEDMTDGATFDGMPINNPFAAPFLDDDIQAILAN